MLSREDRIAIQEARIAAKRERSHYPTSHDMLHRKSAILRQMTFENLNFVAVNRSQLLRGALDEATAAKVKVMIRSALWKARRNGESAKFTGCNIHRI